MAPMTQREVAAMLPAGRRAWRMAQEIHHGQRDAHGAGMIDHVQRVAGAVPQQAQAVAFVHDVCERSGYTPTDVGARLGFSGPEVGALELLTKRDGESLIDHTARVLSCEDAATWTIATAVKRADVGDHIDQTSRPDDGYETAARMLAPTQG